MTESQSGRLVLVATPIGNLGDLSPRAADALRDADAIACEDTRHTRKLLSAQSILGKRLLAVHEHNEIDAARGLVALAEQGQCIALVSDAGMPAISDPGSVVVRAFIDAGLPVECVPGPSAFIVALALSGLPCDRFTFEGFLPANGPGRRSVIAALANESRTSVLYESPHRLVRTIKELAEVLGGQRRIALSRELTKRFEETWRGTLSDAMLHLADAPPRGEFVIVVEGVDRAANVGTPEFDDAELIRRVEIHRAAGLRTRDAVDAVVAESGAHRKHIYALAVSKTADPLPGRPTTDAAGPSRRG
jgi:16S rRNA (cytidine1402-2'-O)-methyltransferase